MIEVKGSVELAPLIGLGDGIVDLVATGRTLEENDLEVREEIVECTARFVANRVAHKLRSSEVDELTAKLREASGEMRVRSASSGTTAAPAAGEIRLWALEAGESAGTWTSPRSAPQVSRGRRRGGSGA